MKEDPEDNLIIMTLVLAHNVKQLPMWQKDFVMEYIQDNCLRMKKELNAHLDVAKKMVEKMDERK